MMFRRVSVACRAVIVHRGCFTITIEKTLPFSQINSRKRLQEVYKNIDFRDCNIGDKFVLSDSAKSVICGRIAPKLAFVNKFSVDSRADVRGVSNNLRAYEVLKEFICFGHGLGPGAELILHPLSEGDIYEDESSKAAESHSSSHSFICDEEEEEEETPKGQIEFAVFDGPGENAKIRAVVEVRNHLKVPNTYRPGPDLSQLFAELLASVDRNWRLDPSYTGSVWGGLTDGYIWIFCRARRDPSKKAPSYIIELDVTIYTLVNHGAPSSFHESGSASTLACIGQIFHGLFPTIKSIDGEEVQQSFSKVDKVLQKVADEFVKSTVKSKLAAAKTPNEIALEAKTKEIEVLKAKLAALRGDPVS